MMVQLKTPGALAYAQRLGMRCYTCGVVSRDGPAKPSRCKMDFDTFYGRVLFELQRRQWLAYSELKRQVCEALPTADALAAVDAVVHSRSASRKTVAPARAVLACMKRHAEYTDFLKEKLTTTYADAVRVVCQWVWDAGGHETPDVAANVVLGVPELNVLDNLLRRVRSWPKYADGIRAAWEEEMAEYTRRQSPTTKRPKKKPARRKPPRSRKKDIELFERRKLGGPELAKQEREDDETMEDAKKRIKQALDREYKRRWRKRKQQESAE